MFAVSTCAKCGGSGFKVVTQEPTDSAYKVIFVQCRSCNTPVGVVDYFNAGVLITEQNKQIAAMKQQLSDLDHMVRQIAHALNQR